MLKAISIDWMIKKHNWLIMTVLCCLFLVSQSTHASVVIDSLLHRILPYNKDAEKFVCVTVRDASRKGDWFDVSCDGKKVTVKGPNNVSLATGINCFLNKAGIDISWNAPTASLPRRLPLMEESHTSKVGYRYYLNFCTHSYSMAFWDWRRWQQEIDWMALHGVNLPLITEGMECVWKKVLMDDYGYPTLGGVNKFVTGSAYYGWFYMNNMTEWGGPQPQSWFDQREQLARQIFRRLKEYGIKPVIPGYVGMIPKDFFHYATKATSWKPSDIISSGLWCQFTRPYFVNDTTKLKEFAKCYYQAIDNLYGEELDTHYYAIDPFHEGSVPKGVDASLSIEAMWHALKDYDKDAVWVAQHWQGNPTADLTHTIPGGRLLILDLHGDSNGETSLGGNSTDKQGKKHQWVWCMTNNFGGNVGLFGRMRQVMDCFYEVARNQKTNHLSGIGAIPEGIENNNVLFDMIYELPWTCDTPYTLDSWLRHYITLRYGITENTDPRTFRLLLSAWNRLAKGIYNCPNAAQQGTTESVFMMRPAVKPGSVSTWANSTWYWDLEDLRTAASEFLSVAGKLRNNDNYRYDLVDIMRQALADKGKEMLDSISKSSQDKDKLQRIFLDMILDQDKLVGTRREFRLGTWIEMARALGTDDNEKNLYEKNARMLLTTWGGEQQCNGGGLHDYANREWNGLLSSYYYPRWAAYFSKGSQNWFRDYEWPFVEGKSKPYGSFSSIPSGDETSMARKIYKKYLSCKK